MVSRPLVFAVLGYLGFRALSKATAAKKFNYGLEGLPTVTIQAGNGVITFRLTISNPSGENFNVEKVQSDIFLNSQFIGNVTNTSKFSISPYGATTVLLTLTVYLTNAALSLISAFQSGIKNGVTVSLKGAVTANGVNVPIEYAKKF